MASCTYCNSFILFGGKTDASGRYCNEQCQGAGHLLAISNELPQDAVATLVQETHQGECPKCRGSGPVDVHKAHRVWSALILTSWSSSPEISCKRCGVKRQIGAATFSLFLGWWGFPWGVIMTPVQITRNVIEIFGGPNAASPSPLLERYVRIHAASRVIQATRQHPSASTPPLLPVGG